jgi:hypothetical protein
VPLAVKRLLLEPLLFLHPAAEGCEDCNEARATVPS